MLGFALIAVVGGLVLYVIWHPGDNLDDRLSAPAPPQAGAEPSERTDP